MTQCMRYGFWLLLGIGIGAFVPSPIVATTATPTSPITSPVVGTFTPTRSFTPTPTATATPPPYIAVATATARPCVGDCNQSGIVTVDEIVTGVSIVLGTSGADACVAFDNPNVSQLVRAVGNLLGDVCLPPDPLPDLVFDNGPYVYGGACMLANRCVNACLANAGNAAAPAFDVLFGQTESDEVRVRVSALPAGVGQCVGLCTSSTALAYTGTAVIDPQNEVEESREDNNTPTFSYPTPTPSISCP